MWETFSKRRSVEIAHVLSKPHWISFKMVYVDAFLVGVFSQIEIWKWYSFVSFLTCENNHNFSGKTWVTNYWAHPLIPSNTLFSAWDSRMLSLSKSTLGSCMEILLPMVTQCEWNTEIPWNLQIISPLLTEFGTLTLESELESQGPICYMNAISGYPQYYCFPFK